MGTTSPLIPLLPKKTVDSTALPDTSYVDAMRKISQGDLRSVLTGGDRLMALSGLLGSVARGSRTTPQEAMAQVQQTALGRASLQMQLAQLEAAQAARLKQQTDAMAFSETIKDPAKRRTFLALPPEEQVKRMAKFTEDATPFGTKEANGKTFMIMSDQSTVELSGIPEDVKGEWRSYDINGDGIAEDVFTNTRTGKPIMNENQQALFVSPGMTAAQKDASVRGWANYGLDVKKFNRGDGAGGGSGGGKEQEVWVGGTGGKPVKTLAYRDKSSPTGWRQYGTNMVVRRVPNPGNGLLAPVTVIPAAPE